MSASLGVCASSAISLLTDAATVRTDDGRIHAINCKQAAIAPRGFIAWLGWTPPALSFVTAARRDFVDFDGIVDAAPYLWRDIRNELRPPLPWIVYSILLAGWSERRQQLELYELNSAEPPNGAEIIVSAGGSPNEADEATVAFCSRFAEHPDTFDVRRDGIGFMQQARRHVRQFEIGPPRHVTGGFVQATRLTRDAVTSAIIHRWPDRVGEHIQLEAA